MISIIKTKDQYEKALARSYKLMQMSIEAGSAELDELEMLVALIKEYEAEHYPM